MNKIYICGADIGSLEIKYVMDALENGWYENKYYYCETLEKEFAEYHNRKYALMTPNCTSSIHLLLSGLGIGIGDEVIIPDCTWIASSVGVVHLGAKPVFCDIDSDTWCLDLNSVEKSITKKTKAIIAVDLYGNMPDWDGLNEISKKYNIPILEDAAEALGSSYKGTKAGKFGIGSTFSFHNTKTMTTGEGGMLLLDDNELYKKCVKLRDLGRGPDTKPYLNDVIGYKYMPFNIQAALGLAQFERLDQLLEIKRKHFEFYKKHLSDLRLKFNYEDKNIINGVWATTIILDKKYNLNKNDFIKKLKNFDIPARPFFYPLSFIPAYNLKHIYKDKNPISYDISERGITLPGAMNLTNKQLQYICSNIIKILITK